MYVLYQQFASLGNKPLQITIDTQKLTMEFWGTVLEGQDWVLSLSHDIVLKGNNGKINIESKEGEGSEFIIDLSLV